MTYEQICPELARQFCATAWDLIGKSDRFTLAHRIAAQGVSGGRITLREDRDGVQWAVFTVAGSGVAMINAELLRDPGR